MSGIGIHALELATAHHVLDLGALADATGVDPAKYRVGLGQDEMSMPAADEDIVTLGATAALQILERHGSEGIRTLLFATESGLDQSKAAGVFAHRLLGLPATIRVVEFKQACYAGAAALQAAVALVARSPEERVLVIASDVARYALGSPGEATQGAGAVAMLVSADPALLAIEPASGIHTEDVDDFWRPNDSSTAVVDGALSISAYLGALTCAWDDLAARGGPPIERIDRFVYHQPFTKMARKAHRRLGEHLGLTLDEAGIDAGAAYNRRLGNSYTASLFAGLAGLLDLGGPLTGRRIALFSYGSGSVSELLTGVVQEGAGSPADGERRSAALDARVPLDVPAYRALHAAVLPSDRNAETPRVTGTPFRFAGIEGRRRRYERTAPMPSAP